MSGRKKLDSELWLAAFSRGGGTRPSAHKPTPMMKDKLVAANKPST